MPSGPATFNTLNQAKRSWHQRVNLACDLLKPAIIAGTLVNISDVGCGDEKLKHAFAERGWAVTYRGFDLIPQSTEVLSYDLNSCDRLPGRADAVVALGVLEYVNDVAECLRRLSDHAPLLVVSHTLRDGDEFGDDGQRERGWKNHLYANQFELLLSANHWRVTEHRDTSDGRTRLWLATTV